MRPRLLFLSHRLPYPPHNGAAIRTFNVLGLLARHYDITALCFDRADAATARWSLRDRISAMEHLGRFEVFPIPQEARRTRLLWDHARSIATGRAYTYFIHDSRTFAEGLDRVLKEQDFDLVHVDSLDLVHHLDRLPADRVILTHHNVESALLERRAQAESSPLRRRYLETQARFLAREERRWVPRVALNVAVSGADGDALASTAGGGRFIVVPNGVDIQFFAPRDEAQHGIVFVGGTSYFPNLDAIRWFAAEILPELRRMGWNDGATFVGRATETEVAHFNAIPGMHLTGYVDDVRPYLAKAACFIAPLRVGGGTRLKLVDAWAMGKAIVSTTLGAEGLNVAEGENILIRDTPHAIATAVMEVSANAGLRSRLERGARATAETIYSWDVIERDMIRAYEHVRAGAKPAMSRAS